MTSETAAEHEDVTAGAPSEPRPRDRDARFPAGRLASAVRRRSEAAFERLFGPPRRKQFKRLIVRLSLLGLAVHLGLVFLARRFDVPPVLAAVGTDYLSALYTPFSFILFYEVLLLILSIPESTTRSLGKQYEILSLIVIRNVFKDIAEFESVTELGAQIDEFAAILWDMGGGVGMFLLVAVFYHVNGKRPRTESDPARRERVQDFIVQKKTIALFLTVLLFGLAGVNLVTWSIEVLDLARFGAVPTIDIRTIFYLDLFTVMIFADAVILILSLRLSSRYELVFRNAAFVASTVLLRFSIAMKKPYDVELGLLAIAFGTLVVLIYNYYLRVNVPRPTDEPPAERG